MQYFQVFFLNFISLTKMFLVLHFFLLSFKVEPESEFPSDLKNESQHRTVATHLGSIPVHNRTINHHPGALSKAQILQSNRLKENQSETSQLQLITKPNANKDVFLIKSTAQSPNTSSNHSNTVQSRNRRIPALLQVTPKIPSHQVVKRPVSASTMKVSTVSSPKTYLREQPVPLQDGLHLKSTLSNGPELPHINTQNYCLNSQVPSSKPVSQITPTPRTTTTTEQGKPKVSQKHKYSTRRPFFKWYEICDVLIITLHECACVCVRRH